MPEVTKETINQRIADAEAKAVSARNFYESRMALNEYADQDRDAIEHGSCPRTNSYSHVANYKRVIDAEASLRHAKDVAKMTKLRAAYIQLSVYDCYAIKDALKAKGYKWSSYDKAWTKDASLDSANSDISDLVALGITPKFDVDGSSESVLRNLANYLA
jgi:hypothetical protein